MSTPFVVPQQSQGQWIDLGVNYGDGSHLRIKFDGAKGMVVQRVIPAKIMRAVAEEARHSRDIWKKGKLLGNTQRHWLPIAVLPKHIDAEWKRELGPMKHNQKEWKKRINNSEYANFRASEARA